MNFFRKMFGTKVSSTPELEVAAPRVPTKDPTKDPNMIRVLDAYGRELFITKQAWRDSVLLGHIKKVWNDPQALYSTIVQGLTDGFGADMVEPAEHLASIDPSAERGTVLLANVYREQKRPRDSERLLRQYISQHGESGLILTNLAKVQSDKTEQLTTLWRAIELDPNQENALDWYGAIHLEQGGREGRQEALQRIAALPKSWRARLWLARASLEAHELPMARIYYQDALSMAGRPVPTDLLMQMSGDLGKAGHLEELLDLTMPNIDLSVHGLQVGNNLIKALLDSGRIDSAHEILQQLYAQRRPDWKQALSFWDNEIAKARAAATPVDSMDQIKATLVCIDGPIWMPEQSPARKLFHTPAGRSIRIAFLGSTAETGAEGNKPIHQITDGPGRLSRALPLFLAEQAYFRCGVSVSTLQPWLLAPNTGFILSGMPSSDGEVAEHAQQCEPACDYVFVTHLKTSAEPWDINLWLVRASDGKCLARAQAELPSNHPQPALSSIAEDMLKFLVKEAGVTLEPAPEFYKVPTDADLASYLVRLEQLLAVRCSSMEGTAPNFLSGGRDILDGDLQLCLNQPKNATVRILLLQTCLSMKSSHPGIVSEYIDKLERLQAEHPLSEPTNSLVLGLLASVVVGEDAPGSLEGR